MIKVDWKKIFKKFFHLLGNHKIVKLDFWPKIKTLVQNCYLIFHLLQIGKKNCLIRKCENLQKYKSTFENLLLYFCLFYPMERECDPMCFVFIKKGLTDCICENDGNGVCKTIHDPETVQKGKFFQKPKKETLKKRTSLNNNHMTKFFTTTTPIF